jgi:DNA-directed RNA polymerase subunit RPC12/RpoP
MATENQRRMRCPECSGIGIYDSEQDRFFCMDCGFDSKDDTEE